MISRSSLLCLAFLFPLLSIARSQTQVKTLPTAAYAVEFDVVCPGTPELVYDRLTGDITGWWDHSFSQKPLKLYIEPRPGGGFYEIFNDKGDGVRHATVLYAERGKMLRFEGPLGLSGRAVQVVTTYRLSPLEPDSTKLTLAVHMQGEVDEKLADRVNTVWHHFLLERFKPYMEQVVRATHGNSQ